LLRNLAGEPPALRQNNLKIFQRYFYFTAKKVFPLRSNIFMSDTVERFSNRVENYVKYRPGYPPEVLRFFRAELNLQKDSVVADIGSGTGISARIFLENGNAVYGVEPNRVMRGAAEEFLKDFPNFTSVDGTSENTTLAGESIDFVTAAQAFHWFDPPKTRAEFKRILKPDGYAVLIWNERRLDADEFHRDYENFLVRFGTDYEKVRHDNIPHERLADFFQTEFGAVKFQNKQILDFGGLRGRMLSSSYMPNERDARFPEIEEKLFRLFTKHAESGRISLQYDTNLFYGRL
jgi:SAM-dependent methyltransferase